MKDEEDLIRRIEALPALPPPPEVLERLRAQQPSSSPRARRRRPVRRILAETVSVACCLVLVDGVIWYARSDSKRNLPSIVMTTYTTLPSDSARYQAQYYVTETGAAKGSQKDAQFRLRVNSWGTHAIYVGVTSDVSSAITTISVDQPFQSGTSNGSAVGTKTSVGRILQPTAPPAQEESAEFAAVNAFLTRHGYSPVGFMQYVNQKFHKYAVLQGFFTSTEAVPLNDWRLVMADVKLNANHRAVLKWVKLIPPQQNRTLLSAVKATVNPEYRNVRLLWDETVGQYAFGLATYEFRGSSYVLPFMEKRERNSTWILMEQGVDDQAVTPYLRRHFNVYQMGGGGTVSNPMQSYLWQTGLVFNPAIVKVKLLLSNGQTVVVPVRNGAFGYAPPLQAGGKAELVVRSITAYNAAGRVIPSMKK